MSNNEPDADSLLLPPLRLFLDVFKKRCGSDLGPSQVELPVHYFPFFRIHTGKLAGIEAHRSEPAVAGRIFFRIGGKQVAMFGIIKRHSASFQVCV